MWLYFTHRRELASSFCGFQKTTPGYEKENTKKMHFGTYIKDLRIAGQITLRDFAKRLSIDPSNWSKIERAIMPPPSNETLIPKIIELLKLDSTQVQQLEDLATVARGELPKEIDDAELLAKIPAFFRALKGREYTAEDLDKLTQKIKDLNTP